MPSTKIVRQNNPTRHIFPIAMKKAIVTEEHSTPNHIKTTARKYGIKGYHIRYWKNLLS